MWYLRMAVQQGNESQVCSRPGSGVGEPSWPSASTRQISAAQVVKRKDTQHMELPEVRVRKKGTQGDQSEVIGRKGI